jgi:hypothetical protein
MGSELDIEREPPTISWKPIGAEKKMKSSAEMGGGRSDKRPARHGIR